MTTEGFVISPETPAIRRTLPQFPALRRLLFDEHFQQYPVMAGPDPATHPARLCGRMKLIGAPTRAGWVAASVGGHDGLFWRIY
jgi:hypothetical protein